MKAMRPIITSNGVFYLKMRSVGSHSKSEREKEGRKGRGEWSQWPLSGTNPIQLQTTRLRFIYFKYFLILSYLFISDGQCYGGPYENILLLITGLN